MLRTDTIFAVSTAPGTAGIAVVRVSGPDAGTALSRIAGKLPAPRRATLARLTNPTTSEAIDRGIVLWFPGPASATGDDVAEFHLHGGRAVIAGLMASLRQLPGLRMAAPGEFTRRAFDNGKLDLTEVEGLADLLAAETAAQHRQALAGAEGGLKAMVADWCQRLVRAAASLEAAIDFPEETDPEAAQRLAREVGEWLQREIEAHLDQAARAEAIRDGFRVAILGPPNSGKSTLLNALAGRDVAIVAPTPGTTRDVLEIRLDLGGHVVLVADTAGLRETSDSVEAEGIRRGLAEAASADLRIVLRDASTLPGTAPDIEARMPRIEVWNKSDLAPERPERGIAISARTGAGIPVLIEAIRSEVENRLAGPPALVTRYRHVAALEDCHDALYRLFHVKHGHIELLAECLHEALDALAVIDGKIGVEEILDTLFREFCIGK